MAKIKTTPNERLRHETLSMRLADTIRRRWLILFVGWSIFGWMMGVQSYVLSSRAGHLVPFGLALEREMVYAYMWALLTPYVLALGRRFPFGPKIWIKNGAFHFCMSLAVALFHKFCYHLVTMFLEATPQHPFSFQRILEQVYSYIDYGMMVYWVLLFMDYSMAYYKASREQALRSARLETLLTHAQLQALKMQIRPHFLFNTLNAISVLIQKNPETAREMVLRLSELLRMTLDREHKEEVTLEDEMEFLNRYLQIEKTRFEDRLQVQITIDDAVSHASVPTMILQPLVENAMRHGAAKQREVTMVEIHAERQNGLLLLRVYDNGPGAPDNEIIEGIGFSNIRSRLEQLFGAHHSFNVRNADQGGFQAEITIPFRALTDQEPQK
jgi:two-component system LytT family sensor kinase